MTQSQYTDRAIQRDIDRDNFQAHIDRQIAKPAGESLTRLSKFVRILTDMQSMQDIES